LSKVGFEFEPFGTCGIGFADAPRFAIRARGEVVVALVVATDGHPGAVGQLVDGGFAELLGLRLVEVSEHLKRRQIVVHQCEGVLLPGEVVQRDVELAVESLEGVEDEEGRVAGLFREALRGRVIA
jgi:hypothetical protein